MGGVRSVGGQVTSHGADLRERVGVLLALVERQHPAQQLAVPRIVLGRGGRSGHGQSPCQPRLFMSRD
jgi:hypothetical protein